MKKAFHKNPFFNFYETKQTYLKNGKIFQIIVISVYTIKKLRKGRQIFQIFIVKKYHRIRITYKTFGSVFKLFGYIYYYIKLLFFKEKETKLYCVIQE